MNITILTNPQEYPYHITIANIIINTLNELNHTVSSLDINSYKFDHQCLSKIKSLNPHVLITLDLSGFRFSTLSGENALNMLTTKNLNIIWGNKPEYAVYLNKKISLSMLFYDVSGVDNKLPGIYPNLLYYKSLGTLSTSLNLPNNTSCHQESFLTIWQDFLIEVLLLEA